MANKFAYTDELDKCYGLSGVVLSLHILDNEYMIHRITLDAGEGDCITFTPDFYFSSNPRYSAKIAWNEMVKQYQLLIGMLSGDVLSRYIVHRRTMPTTANVRELRDLVMDEGRDICSLEEDEINTLFNKTFRYIAEAFSNTEVHRIADAFAHYLQQRRTLYGDEIEEQIHLLRR